MGATVYITGRKKESLYLTAKEIGEGCRPIVCDHSDDSQGGVLRSILRQSERNVLDQSESS